MSALCLSPRELALYEAGRAIGQRDGLLDAADNISPGQIRDALRERAEACRHVHDWSLDDLAAGDAADVG